MRKKLCLMAVLTLALFGLAGCGTPMYELTEDEEDLIVQYAAYALAKYNVYQKDGMTNARQEDKAKEPETSEETEISGSESSEPTKDDNSAGETSPQESTEKTIAEAAGLPGALQVSCTGSRITDSYREGRYFSVNASENRKLLVMQFKIKNTGKKAQKLDMTESGCSFSCSFEDGNPIPEKKTFGEKILSTYSGKIKADASEKVSLIFEVTKDQAKKYQSGKLLVKVNGQTFSVKK